MMESPVGAETMRELDRLAAESGVPALFLMENAGKVVYEKAAGLLGRSNARDVAIFCGKGNNGGDGLVAARKLAEAGFKVKVYLFGRQKDAKGETAVNLRLFTSSGGRVDEIISESDAAGLKDRLECSLIIDSILGTGFSGPISGTLEKLIEVLNSSGVPILAVDVPSGLDPTTGEVDPVAVTAGWTTTFALPKKGFYKNSGAAHTGKVQVVNIGFSEELIKKAIEFEKRHERAKGKT